MDLQIRPIRANDLRVPELNPFFANRVSGHKNIANLRFEAIRANRSNVIETPSGFSANGFARIDRANRPDACCESPGHLRFALLLCPAEGSLRCLL